jgi:hypothetical protein
MPSLVGCLGCKQSVSVALCESISKFGALDSASETTNTKVVIHLLSVEMVHG